MPMYGSPRSVATCARATFAALVAHQETVDKILQQDPNIAAFMGRAGGGGRFGGNNTGGDFIRLKPRRERKLSADELIQSLRGKLAAVPGMRVFLQNPPAIQIGARAGKGQYQYTLQGSDIDALYAFAKICEADLAALPELQDVSSDLQLSLIHI